MDAHRSPHPTAETLEAYGLGNLDEAQLDAIGRHLEDCPECRRRVAEAAPDTFLDRLRDAQAGPGGPGSGGAGPTVDPVATGDVPMVSDDTGTAVEDSPDGAALVPGTRVGYFGDYELQRVLGEGGMGIVYKARQISLNRPVALKMIRATRFPSADEVRRLHNEAEAVARLDHPNIVPIFEVGRYEDQHYFSMKLIAGESLDRRLQDYKADPPRAARLVAVIADAIHHAHQRGILHRDLKPANILVDPDGQPHVTDFGLAKRVEGDSELTRSGAIVGTPAYMAPEQASGKRGAVTTSTDVYGLGAILYALSVGRAPFIGATVLETLEAVRERQPESPRRLNPGVPRDLEVICLKCLEKDPRRRYASADALAEDLRRWLGGEPIAARPVGTAGRLWMWARRNPVVSALIAIVAASLLALAAMLWLYADRQSQVAASERLRGDELERHLDEQAKAAARLRSAMAQSKRRMAMLNFERAHVALKSGEVGPGLLWMVRAFENATDAGDPAWKHTTLCNLSAWLPRYPRLKAVASHSPEMVAAVAFSPDGTRFVTGGADRTARLADAATGDPIGQIMHHPAPVRSVAFSPDGRFIIAGSGDGRARLWDASSTRLIGLLEGVGADASVVPRPDGRSFLVFSVRLGPDRSIITGTQLDHARIGDVAPGKPIGKAVRVELPDRFYSVAYSPDAKTLAGRRFADVQVLDTATGRPIGRPLEHHGVVTSVTFSHDGKTILTASMDKTARLWDAATHQPIGQAMTHRLGIRSAVFSLDDGIVLTGSDDGTARLWDAVTGDPLGQPLEHQEAVASVAYGPDGGSVLTASHDGTARLWHADIGQPIGVPLIDQRQQLEALSPDGRTIVTTDTANTAWLWDARTAGRIGAPMIHNSRVRSVVFSPDGKTVATTVDSGSAARLWDASTGRPIGPPLPHHDRAWCAAFSPDGKTVVTGSFDKTVRSWDAATGAAIGQPMDHPGPVSHVAFSPDGRSLATIASFERIVRLWDPATGRPLRQLAGHHDAVTAVGYSPDGTTLITGSLDKTARLWDAATGRPLGPPLQHGGIVSIVAYGPDGTTILTASFDRRARLWNANTRQPIGQPMIAEGPLHTAIFSPDGKTVLSTTLGNHAMAQLLDASTARPIGAPIPILGVSPALFSPDGQAILVAGGFMIQRWDVPPMLPDDVARLSNQVTCATGLEWDEQGAIRILDGPALREARRRFARSYGPAPATTAHLFDPVLYGATPAARADGLRDLARWDEAETAYAEACRARPRCPDNWIGRAQYDVLRKEPAKAVAALKEAIRLNPDALFLPTRQMVALVASSDFLATRLVCSALLDQFRDPNAPYTASHVAWSCALAPDGGGDPEKLVRLAEVAVMAMPDGQKSPALKSLGAALFRAGRFGDAIRRFEEGIRLLRGHANPQDWAFLAMAHQGLGHRAEARRWLDRLRNRQPGDDPAAFWDELEIRLLRSEAEAMILYDPVFPADPFAH